MTQYFGIDWLAMCLTFTAIYLLGNKSRNGFVIMMPGNVCWSVIGVWAHSYAMVIANVRLFFHERARVPEVGVATGVGEMIPLADAFGGIAGMTFVRANPGGFIKQGMPVEELGYEMRGVGG